MTPFTKQNMFYDDYKWSKYAQTTQKYQAKSMIPNSIAMKVKKFYSSSIK
jgi:hypothetical protein